MAIKPTENDISTYIAQFSPDVQEILQKIRAIARKAAPEAEEIISYRMPALRMNGILIYFAAFKKHIGIFPPVSGDKAIEESIAPYAGPKGNLQFPLDQPIPYTLIERIVKLRVKQDDEKAIANREKRKNKQRNPKLATKQVTHKTNRYSELIRTIYEQGCYSREGRDALIGLAKGGDPALHAFILSQDDPPPSDLHPRDLLETRSDVYCEFARQNPDAVIDRFEKGQIDEFSVLWALGSATGNRSIGILIEGLKNKELYCRWAAAKSLIRRKCKTAIGPIIDRLDDRSSFVKSSIVQGMHSNRVFRSPEALPALARLIANKSVQKHDPGTIRMATEVVEMIKSEWP